MKMKFNFRKIICCIAIFVILAYILHYVSDIKEGNTNKYTNCGQVTAEGCAKCVGVTIKNAKEKCLWDPQSGCNSFNGSGKCPAIAKPPAKPTYKTPPGFNYHFFRK